MLHFCVIIKVYLGKFYFSGPNDAKIDNADRPKANVEGMVIGDYVFKLTVYDSEDLKSSANLVIRVRERKSYV